MLLIPFSNSDLRHNDPSRNGRNLHVHNLNSRNGSKRERDEHIERYWQPTLQREYKIKLIYVCQKVPMSRKSSIG